MQDIIVTVAGYIVALLAMILLGGMPLHYRNERNKARNRAERQFREYRSMSADGTVQLIGSAAQVLDSSQSYTSHNGKVHDYVLTLFAVTPEGQHFLFKSNENGNPYVSMLSPERARLVLKDKCREAIAK